MGGYPGNLPRGLPQITGLLIFNDAETGLPLAVMDCTWITAMRTGAATAVAAKYLARQDSKSVAILGCGVQGRSNLQALAAVLPNLTEVRAYDILPETSQNYAREGAELLGVSVEPVDTPEQAVRGADVVVTAVPIVRPPHYTVKAGWLSEGAFASAVDFDMSWEAGALAQMDLIATDDLGQFKYYRELGYFQQVPEPHTDLGQLASGQAEGRTDDSQRIIAFNLGMAIEDVIVAQRLYQLARAQGLGVELPL